MLPDYDFWRKEELNLSDDVSDIAVVSVVAGAEAGLALLPNAIKPLVNEEIFNLAAMNYLRLYQLRDVHNIAETTRRKATQLIQEWLLSGDSLPALEAKLALILGDRRAAQIAVTEVTRLFAQGNIMLWQSTGVVTSKVWRTARDEIVCPMCGTLDGMVVSLEANFQQSAEDLAFSAQMKKLLGPRYNEETALRRAQNMIKWHSTEVEAPPRHVNCRCYLQPVVSIQAYEDLPIG